MFSLYKCLLWLYPTSHRREYGEEMTAVFYEARTEIEKKIGWAILFALKRSGVHRLSAMQDAAGE